MFAKSQELIDFFALGEDSDYRHLAPFSGQTIGLSVRREYPPNCRFHPPRRADGIPDAVALIQAAYNPQHDASDEHRVPLVVRVFPFSEYEYRHSFGYDHSNPMCPTEDSLIESAKTPKPLRLRFEDDFFVDHVAETLFDKSHEPVTGKAILDYVFKEHCATVDEPRGTRFRWRLKRRQVMAKYCVALSDAIEWIMKRFFGRVFTPKDPLRQIVEGYQEEDIGTEKTDTLNIFGYSAPKSVILLFCLLVVVGFSTLYGLGLKPRFIKNVIQNTFLSLCFTIVFLWILDVMFPWMLFKTTKGLFRAKRYFEESPLEFK